MPALIQGDDLSKGDQRRVQSYTLGIFHNQALSRRARGLLIFPWVEALEKCYPDV